MTLADKLKALRSATAARDAAVVALTTPGKDEDATAVLVDGEALVDIGAGTVYANIDGRIVALVLRGIDDPRTPAPARA